MAFFIVIVVLNFVQITYCIAQTILVSIIIFSNLILLGCVDLGDQNEAFLTLLILLLLLITIFLLFATSFYRKL